MKKLLSIVLALTLVIGVFAGLSLFSLTATAESSSSLTDGKKLFVDFENEADVTTYLTNGEFVSADALAAANVPAKTSTGKNVGNVVKYVGVDRWDGLSVSSSAVDKVVDGAGWYVLSAWVYCENWTDGDQGQTLKINLATSKSKYKTATNGLKKSNAFQQWSYFEAAVYVDKDWYDSAEAANQPFSFRFDSWGKNPYYVAELTFAKLDGTDYSLVKTGKLTAKSSIGFADTILTGANFPLVSTNNPESANEVSVFDIYNFNSAYAKLGFRIGTSEWGGSASSSVWQFPAPNAKIPVVTSRLTADEKANWATSGGVWAYNHLFYTTNAVQSDKDATQNDIANCGWLFGADISGLTDTAVAAQKGFLSAADQCEVKVVKNAAPANAIANNDVTKGNVWYYANAEGLYTANATVYDGYYFLGWYTGSSITTANVLISTETQITTYGDQLVVALFSADTATPTPPSPTPEGTPVPLAPTTIVNGNAEEGSQGVLAGDWVAFSAGTMSQVDDAGGNGKAASKVAKFVPSGLYGSASMIFSKAIVNIEGNATYQGGGADKYVVSFWIKLDTTDANTIGATAGKVRTMLDWQGAGARKQLGACDEDLAFYDLTITDQWQKVTRTFDIDDEMYDLLVAAVEAGVPNAVQLRFEASNKGYGGMYANDKMYAYLVDDVTIEVYKAPVVEEPDNNQGGNTSKPEGTGDVLPVALIATVALASVALAVVSKKRKED